MAEKVFFIINPFSGKGTRSRMDEQIRATCSHQNLESIIGFTDCRGHATELARQAVKDGIGRIFAAGGDGTVNEVAQALIGTPVAMGILPRGSGNGLARHLRIPLPATRSLQLLNRSEIIAMDTLQVNGQLCVNVAGIGFDAHIASLFGADGKRGLASYARLVLKEFYQFKEFQMDAELDGVAKHHHPFVVALANSSQFGNDARIAPHASVCDGLMDVCFIRKVPMTEVVGFTAKLFLGQLGRSRFTEIINAKEFKAKLSAPMPYHIDGEPCGMSDTFNVRVNKGSLKVIVPVSTRSV
ncbi:MAG: diacylglycerol kinase family lipid kinase [Cytophagales bacterium]|nr:diacylglycerol kinase family lipid kinase [Cytophagales bacterium]